MPVDEYTFTVPRQPPSHLQQQQAFFQAQQQCLAADPSAALNDNANNWMGYHLQLNSQLQPSMQNTEGDQAPPTPPPRLASAMNTMQFTRASRNVPMENATWQVSFVCEIGSSRIEGSILGLLLRETFYHLIDQNKPGRLVTHITICIDLATSNLTDVNVSHCVTGTMFR